MRFYVWFKLSWMILPRVRRWHACSNVGIVYPSQQHSLASECSHIPCLCAMALSLRHKFGNNVEIINETSPMYSTCLVWLAICCVVLDVNAKNDWESCQRICGDNFPTHAPFPVLFARARFCAQLFPCRIRGCMPMSLIYWPLWDCEKKGRKFEFQHTCTIFGTHASACLRQNLSSSITQQKHQRTSNPLLQCYPYHICQKLLRSEEAATSSRAFRPRDAVCGVSDGCGAHNGAETLDTAALAQCMT